MVLITATLLSLASNSLWISYSAVAEVSTEYFDKTVNEIDLLATISFIVGIPMCLVSTYVVDVVGFRAGILLSSLLTFFGGLIRCLSTLPGINTSISLDTQFWLSVFAQALTGMGNPLAVSLPTKVSQNWFPESERTLATGILAMSLPLGIVFGQGLSPLFVKGPDDIPILNIVGFIPATVTLLLCLFFVRTSLPPTPPSKSAEIEGRMERKTFREYLANMKAVMTNRSFLILFATIGGAVGFFNAFLTQLSQLMCSRGYDNVFSGVCASLTLAMGLIGAIGAGVMVEKFGKMMEITKVFNIVAGVSGVLISVFMTMSNKHAFLATFCTLFGIFGFGMYPMALELSVEATYPIDESIGTALIFLSGQLQGGILIFVSEMLEQELDEEELLLEVCSSFSSANTSDVTTISTTTNPLTSIATQPTIANQMTTLTTTKTSEAADHSNFLIVLAVYIFLLSLVFTVFFKTDFKRTQANAVEANMNGKKDNLGFEMDNTGL